MCEKGHWDTLWTHAEMQTQSTSQNDVEERDKTATRVNKLMEAKEISKAA